MKSKALYLTFLPAFLFATNIQNIVDSTFEKNYELKSIEQSIEIASQDIKLSKKYQNPILTFGANDIYFDEPFSRDKEAMQAQYIGISQTIESSDKLRFKEEIQSYNKEINQYILEDKKLVLQSIIYQKAWDILVLKERKEFLESFIDNLKKLQILNENYYEIGKSNQNNILELKIRINEVELKLNTIENRIENLFVDLKSISYLDIKQISEELNYLDKSINVNIESHPKIEILNEQIKQQKTKAKLEDEKKFSDFKVNVAYFNRDDKFKDYANISVSIPLGINDKENIEILKSKFQVSKLQNVQQNLIDNLNAKLETLKNNMNFSKKSIDLIQNQIIPLKKLIQENIENYISLNEESYKKLISNLNELLAFEIKTNEYKKEYFESLSQLIYLNQGINNDKK